MLRALSLCLILLLVGVFALINWSAFAAPTALNLGVTTVQAPLGMIMLAVLAFLCVLFVVWVISLQASSLAASRRQTRELQAQRDLADRAEASRFTELRTDLVSRLDQMQTSTRLALEQQGNAIAAQLGQLEDRLDRERPALGGPLVR